MERRSAFCINCHRETACMPRKVKINQSVRDKSYTFEITTFVCSECGREIGFPGLMDYNIKEMDEQYRKAEEIITVEDIERLMKLYNIGKAPLSLALGFGEVTITRYLAGQVPSKEYSDIMLHALASASYMKELLDQNREKIGETAYKKAYTAATQLENLYVAVPVELLAVIAYIFSALHEVTPLTLQKPLMKRIRRVAPQLFAQRGGEVLRLRRVAANRIGKQRVADQPHRRKGDQIKRRADHQHQRREQLGADGMERVNPCR